MSEKVSLKAMRCPTCGGTLKAENNTDAIVCVYCGNTIVPVNETAAMSATITENPIMSTFNGVLRVEGIKTSSSALAYIEQFYEEYDWEAFTYAQTLSIAEIDKLASSLKASSADDKNTWFVCFKAVSIPFLRKVGGCQQILSSVIEEYEKDNLDAYSKFDAYKRISTMIIAAKNAVVSRLEKFVLNAAKYGASSAEIEELKAEIQNIVVASVVETYENIKDIPAVKAFIQEKNAKIAHELAAEGIIAENEYARAKSLIDEKNYAEALSVLLLLKGYADTDVLIEKIDKYYIISNVLEIEGNLYYFKKPDPNAESFHLYPTVDDKISNKAIIKNIGKIITNYADTIYYLDYSHKLRKYSFSSNVEEKIYDKSFDEKTIVIHNRRAFLLTKNYNDSSDEKNELVMLDLVTGKIQTIAESVKEIIMLTDNKMVYTALEKIANNSQEYSQKVSTNIINVDSFSITKLGNKKISVEGFINNYVVYTQDSPNKYNKNLYIKALDSEEPERLIEQNIFEFCSIIADKMFYYIGNSNNKSLININCDCTERREWPLYISEVLFEQAGWLYFIRKAGYNSILCKSRLDGSKFSIIAADIEKFIEIKNGYMYYINYAATLVKVRMDGSNLQELCDNVESVLAVKEEKIIFVSIDDRIRIGDLADAAKIVKSIYVVDFSGSGKIKLAYNVRDAQNYDENTVYFIAAEEIKSSYDKLNRNLEVLYELDVETNQVKKLLNLEICIEKNESSGFAIAMVIMVITGFFGFISIATGNYGIGVLLLTSGVVSLMIGLSIKSNSKK